MRDGTFVNAVAKFIFLKLRRLTCETLVFFIFKCVTHHWYYFLRKKAKRHGPSTIQKKSERIIMESIGDTQPRFGKYKNEGLTWRQIWEKDADYCVYLVTQPDFAKRNYSLTCFIRKMMAATGLSLEVLLTKKSDDESESQTIPLSPPQQPKYTRTPSVFMPSRD